MRAVCWHRSLPTAMNETANHGLPGHVTIYRWVQRFTHSSPTRLFQSPTLQSLSGHDSAG